MKVLISCYACSPYRGSEPGMGWNFVHCLAPMHELHIITESKYKADLDRYFAEHPDEAQQYHFYFLPRKRYDVLRKIWPPSYYWFYRVWQRKVLSFARQLDAKENFDIVHALNMAGYREPGFLYELGKPLVWGPTGGFCIAPWRLLPGLGFYGMVYYGARNIINICQAHCKLAPHKMAEYASVIIAATQDNQMAIEHYYKRSSYLIPEVGALTDYVPAVMPLHANEVLRICWSSGHMPRKSLHLLLKALPILTTSRPIELHVIGYGQYTKRWQRLAERLNVSNLITWHGSMPHDDAIRIMSEMHLFVITSIVDLTSTVLLEALSLGLPVITLNLCGFSNVVTPECGIKIDVHSEQQVICDIASAIDTFADDEPMRMRMAHAAFHRAMDFTWDEKAKQISNIYTHAIKAHQE